jgi:acetyl esterase/lipase
MSMTRIIRVLLGALILSFSSLAAESKYTRVQDVIYGRKFGTALTMDIFKPSEPNGIGVIFVVSGGFFSSKEMIGFLKPEAFLNRGYTVFAVMHGSQPRYIIPEIEADIHRAIRFIRHNAKEYGIDPGKIGVFGASAGGHLTLTMATQGGPGKPDAKDTIDRESSEVQAAACFFPPTDFLNYGKPGEDAVGVGILKDLKAAFGPMSDTPENRQKLGKEISPANFITSKMPPSLIIHGDADTLVPIQQAELFAEKAKEAGATVKIIRKPGKGHGWPELSEDLPLLADWFDQYLRGIKKEQ